MCRWAVGSNSVWEAALHSASRWERGWAKVLELATVLECGEWHPKLPLASPRVASRQVARQNGPSSIIVIRVLPIVPSTPRCLAAKTEPLGRSFIAFGYSIDSCGRAASRLKTEE